MKLRERIKSYKFWVALSASLIILLQTLGKAFGFEIDAEIINAITMAFCSVLMVFGIVEKPKNQNSNQISAPQEENQNENFFNAENQENLEDLNQTSSKNKDKKEMKIFQDENKNEFKILQEEIEEIDVLQQALNKEIKNKESEK